MIKNPPLVLVVEGMPDIGLSSIINNLSDALKERKVKTSRGERRLRVAIAKPFDRLSQAIKTKYTGVSAQRKANVIYEILNERMQLLLEQKNVDVILVERFLPTFFARWIGTTKSNELPPEFMQQARYLSNNYFTWYLNSGTDRTKSILEKTNNKTNVYARRSERYIGVYRYSLNTYINNAHYCNQTQMSKFDLDAMAPNLTVYNSDKRSVDIHATLKNYDVYFLNAFVASFLIND